MKKIITTLILATTLLTANAQKKDTTKATLTDSTYFLSLKQIDRIIITPENRATISVADWEGFWKVLNNFLLPAAIKEWEDKQKPKK